MVMKKSDNDYFKNPTLLFRLIEERQWGDVIEHNSKYGEEANQWVVKRDKDSGSITWRRLPIHEACIRQPTEEVIVSLLKSFPEGARATDTYGRLPLHHACVHGAQEAVIYHLLMAYPDSIEVKDVWGKSPLAAAQATLCGNKNQILELLQKRPSYYAVKVVEQEQQKVLHLQAEKFEEQFQNERDKYQELIDRLKSQLKQAIVEKSNLNDMVMESEGTIYALQSKAQENEKLIKGLEDTKESLLKEVEEHKSKHHLFKEQTDSDLIAQKQAYGAMKEEFEKSKNDISLLQDKLQKKCTEVNSLLDTEANLIATVEEQNDKITQLEKKNEMNAKELTEQCTGYSSKLIILEQSVKEFSEKFSVHEDDLSKVLKKCEQSIKDNELSLLDQVDKLETKVKDIGSEKDTLQKSLAELKAVKDELEITLNDKSSDIDKLQQSIAKVKHNNKNLKEEKNALEKSLKEVTTELESLQQSHANLESKSSSTIGNKEKLLQLYTDKITNLTETIKQNESSISDLKTELEERTIELDDVRKKLETETSDNQSLKDSIAKITSRASALEEKVRHSNGFFTSLDTKFSSMVENQDELLIAASQQEYRNKENRPENSLKTVSEEHERILSSIRQQKVILQSIRSQKLALKMAAAEAMMNEKKSGYVLVK